MSAYARAQELLSSRQQTLLHQGDHQALLAALDKASTPTPALLEAWQLHQDQVVRSRSGAQHPVVLGFYAINAHAIGTADLPVGGADSGCAAAAPGLDA